MTYSLVARDPVTGELAVAVQSHWFSVGAVVPHVRPGVGAVATQSVPEPSHGPRILDLLERRAAPDEALDEVLRGDEGAAYRQTAVVDALGRVATHTGDACMPDAGHSSGEGWSAQANIMLSAGVWPAMADAFTAADPGLPLAERLLAGLDAAQAAGGDVRGQQSAALVVGTEELRVEDHREPLAELRRLVGVQRAYAEAGKGDEAVAEGRVDDAAAHFEEASRLQPENAELLFWSGLSAVLRGDREAGLERARRAIALNPGLGTMLDRLSDEMVPSVSDVRRALRPG